MKKAQSILEYTILIIVIIAAFLATQVYIKRGFQGRWKEATDGLGEQYDTQHFDGSIRYSLDSTTESSLCAVYGVSYNGDQGMITYREDSSTSVETKSGETHIKPAGL